MEGAQSRKTPGRLRARKADLIGRMPICTPEIGCRELLKSQRLSTKDKNLGSEHVGVIPKQRT